MVETRLSEGEGVCLKNDENNLDIKHKPYPLEYPRPETCEFTDPRFKPSMEFKLDEKSFFLVNNAMDLNLPNFTLRNNIYFQHYYRGYVPIGYECRDYVN